MLLFRALLAFLALPGLFSGLFPALISMNDPYRNSGYYFGLLFIVSGFIILIWCVRDFLVAGRGTLAPWDPPTSLVMIGLYRHSRNPMYVGIIMFLAGWAILSGSPLLAAYAAALACAFYVRVVFGEERILAEQFGAEWVEYAKTVPRWLSCFKSSNF
jgi:protein-S-isoprenylcysteine O-methyltransferase Ste14